LLDTVLLFSLICLAIYIAIALKPGIPTSSFSYLSSLFFFGFCTLFLIYIYLYSSSIWITILAVFLLFIFMYVIQFIIGSIKYHIKKGGE
jgi:uncharacterized membrane protein